MTRVAITGYASLDHVVMLDGIPTPGRTTTIVDRPEEAWPRLGGSPSYVAAALAAGGVEAASPISWVGEDEAAQDFRRHLEARNVLTDGIATVAGARTPMAILAYEPNGGCLCLYHPAIPKGLGLTREQKQVIAHADWLCITIGPSQATREALDALSPDGSLCWVVKDDPAALPPDLAVQLAARADLICFSAAEAAFVRTAFASAGPRRAGQVLIETRGGAGAQVTVGATTCFVASEALAITDPTGAGDTFAGGALAALAGGETDPVAIVKAGHKAARALLAGRVAKHNESA
ncbi:carbohydrate kinase family protein [Mesorhizobium sp. CAU 1732]|uniref:carbohydrate kinase family protein n=1 Tax=Mesorhizobium sp. CAU 1732 TaxID=3140358 RepID=UPI0032619432